LHLAFLSYLVVLRRRIDARQRRGSGLAMADEKSELSSAVCSIARTQRRRFFWAAWWSGAPTRRPFRKPDASNGGAASYEDARREAERVSGRTLSIVEPLWARAWSRILRGQPPFSASELEDGAARPAKPDRPAVSAWAILGLEPGADASAIKRAYREKALVTHPDVGGDATTFRHVQQAYERLSRRAAKPKRRRG
jgi:hypothetical protein